MKYTFSGGIHLNEHKNTCGIPIDKGFRPEEVVIPLSQHIGAPCRATVKKGDTVLRGQLIGEAAGALSCPVHASVSGTVTEVSDTIGVNGAKVTCVTIKSDGQYTNCPEAVPVDHHALNPQAKIEFIKNMGISGMGGATFPTYAKINSALGKVDTLIINCSECEPYITANHRLLLEEPEGIIEGTKILLDCMSLDRGIIAIADNKPDAIALFKKKLSGEVRIDLKILKTKYPQGDERQLIYALKKRTVPKGKLPADVGCVVFNTETAYAVWHSFKTGEPLIEKVVTVDGNCVKHPRCVKVPIGSRFSDILEHCGGVEGEIKRMVSGGPMMGATVWDPHAPVTKGSSCILAFSTDVFESEGAENDCIRCGRCVRACPMKLMPCYISQFAKIGDLENSEKFGATTCVECGSCSYVCPSKIPVAQYVRTAKAKLIAKARRDKK